jgi:hypothetical protein
METIARRARALWPGLMALAAAGVAGPILTAAPPALASLVALAAWGAALTFFVVGIRRVKPATEVEAARALERAAGLGELAPLSLAEDRPAGGDEALWRHHRRAQAAGVALLVKPARPAWDRADGLRAGALVLALALIALDPKAAGRALTPDASPLAGDGPLSIEVWADPPAYMGRPSVRLDPTGKTARLPAGSRIRARLDGATGAPVLRGPFPAVRLQRTAAGAWEGEATLRADGRVRVDRLGTRAAWRVEAVPDAPPELLAVAPIRADPRGRLDVAFTATDDHGIAAAALRVTARTPPEGMRGEPTVDWPLSLEGPLGDDGARRLFVDAARHVFAGLEVEARVVVRDALGQEAVGAPTTLIMPARAWSSPLAAALDEQRLSILRERRPWGLVVPRRATLVDGAGDPIRLDLTEPLAVAPPGVVRAHALMRALLATPDQGGLDPLGALALHLVRGALESARAPVEARATEPELWALILRAEAAGRTPAQRRLDEAKQALEQALRGGASEEDVRRLTEEFGEAMRERLAEMAEQAAQSGDGQGGQGGQAGAGMEGEGGEPISGGDIEDMLRRLQESGAGGAREEALARLEELDRLMNSLRVTPGDGQAGEGGRGGGMDEALRDQRALSDETARRAADATGPGAGPSPDLADRQEALARRVEPGPPGASPEASDDPGREGRGEAAAAMREAAEALRGGDLDRAQEAQTRATQALRRAAEAQAQARGGGEGGEDPLGRPGRAIDDGRGVTVPDQGERRRARDVREELRRRQADPKRDGAERDYIDRLLRDRPDAREPAP